MIKKGYEYDFEIEKAYCSGGVMLTIIPKFDDKENFTDLCFVEDLDNLFIAVQKAIEFREKIYGKN